MLVFWDQSASFFPGAGCAYDAEILLTKYAWSAILCSGTGV